ncbi:MAG: YebC/PmpR family DNA-binding transcriptional regulator [Gammaproteobacteria bacterium]|jgi:YebC/PmpR family DNA-binding regulatory protein|nr:YebC/PmpR family DNA-binding transcriptional regulator [Gammaproteobacteria bacterium]MBT6754791.1 YebC/PmpR family DNA-binding transcriptional regulator [Gammaproteobacteria bacterium]MBT7523224.1 YebC/PmpR family DNA-binding transcriptional regulator [Gammaproteobacteria bacterium]
MAGHSKWANIQHRKKRQDNKRGKLFTKLIKEITVASREGGGDADSNPRLRLALDKAFSGNMNKETVEKAINRGTGNLEGVNYEELIYEGYSSSGVAVIVECVTDNKNRTVAEVRHAFSKFSGNLGSSGSVSYLFKKVGIISYEDTNKGDEIVDLAIENNASDVIQDNNYVEIQTDKDDYLNITKVLKENNYIFDNAELEMIADTKIELDSEGAESFMKFTDALEELDDVQNVYTNAEYTGELD